MKTATGDTWMETPYNAEGGHDRHEPTRYYVMWQSSEDDVMCRHCATIASAKRLAGTVNGQVYRLVGLRRERTDEDGWPVWQWDREEVLVA